MRHRVELTVGGSKSNSVHEGEPNACLSKAVRKHFGRSAAANILDDGHGRYRLQVSLMSRGYQWVLTRRVVARVVRLSDEA